MKYTKLGNSDLEVSVVAFGCWGIIGGFNWGPQDKQDSIAALRAAFDAGITFFDTAEGYGSGASEQLVGEGLGDRLDVLPRLMKFEKLIRLCKRLKIFDKSKPPDAKFANGGFALAKILNPAYIS